MSAFNAVRTIGAAVRSIQQQTVRDFELVIADDGSTDQTAGVLAGFADSRIHLLSDGSNLGKPSRMNQIIRGARAPLLAVMDADDIAYPERLERQIEFLDAHPEVDLVAAGMATFDEAGRLGLWRRLRTEHDRIARNPWLGFHFNSPTWMGRTAWFQRHLYTEGLRAAEDEDLLLRAYRTSRFAGLPEILLAYRIDQWSWSKARRMRGDHVRSLIRHLSERGEWRSILGIGMHGAKLAREGMAVATGMSGRLLQYRALPLPADEEARLAGILERVAE